MTRTGDSQGLCIVQSQKMSIAAFHPEPRLTALEYGTLQDAYDHFNCALFEGRLPQVLITLQRHAHARGYFSRNRFRGRNRASEHVHEVALNPDSFGGRSDEDILSTLVHEMAHVWQQEYGHPGRGRYHNREWAAFMYSIGLMPSTTGEPGGAVTGDRVSHYILHGGPFSGACGAFLEKYCLAWEAAADSAGSHSGNRAVVGNDRNVAGNSQTRTKFTCPNCGLNAWAKPDAVLDCHSCSQAACEPVSLCPEEPSWERGR